MHKQLMAIIAAYFIAASAFAETLNFASPAAPRHRLHTHVIEPWIEQMVANSEGSLEVRTFYASPLGNYSNMYDRVLNGVVDIAFTTLAPVGGQFVKTDVAALPFEAQSALEGSIALWNLYENGLIADEFAGIKLLGIFMFPNSALHMSKHPIKSLEDFDGIRIRAAGKIQSDTLALLGALPITAEPSDIYQGLSRGVFDGAIMPWTGVPSYRLHEVTYYHLNAPLGSSVAMIFMNQQAFDALPEAAQRAIDGSSGLSLSTQFSELIDFDASRVEVDTRSRPNQVVWNIDPEEAKRWQALTNVMVEDWVANTPNGAEVLAAFRQQIRQHRATRQ